MRADCEGRGGDVAAKEAQVGSESGMGFSFCFNSKFFFFFFFQNFLKMISAADWTLNIKYIKLLLKEVILYCM